MPQPYYPLSEDLSGFLAASGITLSSALERQFGSTIEAARAELERATGRVFLAGDEETRFFDPPTNRNSVLPIDDLASLTSIVYEPSESSVETLTPGRDYWLEPVNAVGKRQPYTLVRFRRRWLQPLSAMQYQSLQIIGRWGYATEVPDDVWQAILARAAWQLWGLVEVSSTGGILSWTDGGRTINYGVERWTAIKTGWQAQFDQTVARYRKVTL